MRFEVGFSAAGENGLDRLFDFLLGRARAIEDLGEAQVAIEAVHSALRNELAATPYSFRKAANSQTQREIITPFGATGCVALCEIASPSNAVVLAVRHQREEDYR